MFRLFSSKNQKLVQAWQTDHEKIVSLAHKVIQSYEAGELKKTKELLKSLEDLAVDHVMHEDIEFYHLMKEDEHIDAQTEHMVTLFIQSFKKTKLALMNFLKKYTQDDIVLDDQFFHEFKELAEVLAKRIEFEENNVYAKLKEH
jgi:hypothetical protein